MIIDEHLKWWLKGDAGSGNNWDLVGNAPAWSATITATNTANARRGKASFNRFTGYLYPDKIAVGGADFTFDGWIKGYAASGEVSILAVGASFYTSATASTLFNVGFDANGYLFLDCSDSGSSAQSWTRTTSTTYTLPASNWFYYAVIYDNDTHTIKVYIDGNEELSYTPTNGFSRTAYYVRIRGICCKHRF